MKFSNFMQVASTIAASTLLVSTCFAAEPEIKSFLETVPQVAPAQAALKPVGQNISRGVALQLQNKPEEAKKAFREAEQLAESLLKKIPRGYHDELLELKGYAEQQAGDYEGALASYKKAVALRPSSAMLIFREAFALSRLNRCAEAIPKFEEVLWTTHQARHEVLYLTSECNKTLGNTDVALKQMQEAQKLAPGYLPVTRSMVAYHQEQIAKAQDPTQRLGAEALLAADLALIVRLDPQDRQSALTLVRLLIKTGDGLVNTSRLAEAEEMASRFVTSSAYGDEESVKLLFDAQLKRGNVEAARKTVEAGLKKNPKSELMRQANRQLEIEGARDLATDEES